MIDMKRWEKFRKEMYGNDTLTLEDILKDIKVKCWEHKFGYNCDGCPLKDVVICAGFGLGDEISIKYLEEVYHENN